MVGMCGEPLHGVVTQPGAQPLAQLLPGQRLLWAFVEQFTVLGDEGWQFARDQTHRQHGRWQLQMFQAAAGQFEKHGWVTLGAEQTDRHLAVGQLAVLQMQGEALYATVATSQIGGKIGGQTAQREQ